MIALLGYLAAQTMVDMDMAKHGNDADKMAALKKAHQGYALIEDEAQ